MIVHLSPRELAYCIGVNSPVQLTHIILTRQKVVRGKEGFHRGIWISSKENIGIDVKDVLPVLQNLDQAYSMEY